MAAIHCSVIVTPVRLARPYQAGFNRLGFPTSRDLLAWPKPHLEAHMFFLAGDPDITPITTLITTWIHIGQALVASIGALSFILPCRGFPHWGTECRPRRAVDILSAEIASEAFKALPNSVVGTS